MLTVSQQIFSILAVRGRLSLQAIVKFAGLQTRRVSTTLVVLIQHHLILHYTDDNENTFYEADAMSAYNIGLRYGKAAKIVEGRLGAFASKLLLHVAILGHTTVQELEGALEAKDSKKGADTGASSQANGTKRRKRANSKSAAPFEENLQDTLCCLLQSGFLLKAQANQYFPEADLLTEAEKTVLENGWPTGVKNKKERMECEVAVRELRLKWRDAADEYSEAYRTIKRKRSPSPPSFSSHKRQRLNLPNGTGSSVMARNRHNVHFKVRSSYQKTNVPTNRHPG